ncbi:cation-translocating P-type ATPase [Pleionea sediminis]|uniref:cation-translocating P-type ATPase n=1 Tax=Pleionea sediminis TaxID=2569479 RepID=UPI0011857ED7|nr:HAD-IC family P-type ATPase [Pleionea sediminis]
MHHQTLGLTTAEAEKRLAKYGPNELPKPSPPGLIFLFLKQFKSPFIYVLLIAAIVSFALAQTLNGIFILAVLLLNASIGCVQEFSAEKAAQALNALVPQQSNVIRDGHVLKLNSSDIVVGDIVSLASGDAIPADGQLQTSDNLSVNESLLTGESIEVEKNTEPKGSERALSNSDRQQVTKNDNSKQTTTNRCYAATSVVRGRGLLEITHTGQHTEIGKIATAVTSSGMAKPPLLQRIERFTLRVTFFTLAVIALIFIITLSRGEALSQVFFLGVALAVSAIPEGLPAAITVALAIGMRRMARQNVIVRSLLAVESLGSCTYIASDKTGTLTVNDMTIQSIVLPGGNKFSVTGEGFDLDGSIDSESSKQSSSDADWKTINLLCQVGVLSNEAELYLKDNEWHAEGDQVDIAFLILYNKLGQSHIEFEQSSKLISRIPYESAKAYSAALHQLSDGYCLSVKGSAEKVLSMSKLSDTEDEEIKQQVHDLAEQGYRVLALATKQLSKRPDEIDQELDQLNFLGIVGIIDPERKEALAAVEACHEAGIQVAMVTGDHPVTAQAIAKKLHIQSHDEKVVTGDQIQNLKLSDPEALAKAIRTTHTFARVKPLEKQIIVEELQKQGHFVAVTGDGVNDAPALKTAHVGIAMGKRGTDVARESSDLILTDDNFSSIVKGIIQGRIVYANIRKVVFLLISTGAAEILLFILSLLAGLPLPLFPIQLLWLNLVTNGVQDVALAFEPAEGDELKRKPRDPKESIFNRIMIERVVVNALFMGSIAFLLFSLSLSYGLSENEARNLTLLLMVLFENIHALNSRSETQSLFRMPFFSNPLLIAGILISQSIHILSLYSETMQKLLGVMPVTLNEWMTLASIALVLFAVDELHKWFHRRKTSIL